MYEDPETLLFQEFLIEFKIMLFGKAIFKNFFFLTEHINGC